MKPEDLLADGLKIHRADMKYGWPHKFYVDVPNRNPGAAFVLQAGNRLPPPPDTDFMHFVAVKDLSRHEKKIVKRDGWDNGFPDKGGYVGFGTRSVHHGKFYTAHLADPALTYELKASIAEKLGIWIEFADGRVKWRPFEG